LCRKVSKSLKRCTFSNKRLALDALQVRVVATRERVKVKMAVPLEFASIEKRHEHQLPARKKRRTNVEVMEAVD
jgi:hypothetical protein